MIIEKINNKNLILKMKKDIEKTKLNLEHFDSYKKRQDAIKNLKIYGNVVRRLAPYILTAAIFTFGFHFATGRYPFVRDYIKKEISYSNIQQLEFDENIVGYVFHYSEWNKNSDKEYFRKVECYQIDKSLFENIINISDDSVTDLLDSPVYSNIEISDSIDKNNDYYEVILYDKNNQNYRIIKESALTNVLYSVAYFLLLELVEMGPFLYRITYSTFDIGKISKDLDNRYDNFSKENLIKILKIKESNYNKLTK